MKPISVIAFDCDGVLFDTVQANKSYYNAILNHLNMPELSPDQFNFVFMHTVQESLEFLFGKNEKLEKATAFKKAMPYESFILEMEMEPHLMPLLKKLRPRFKTAIATNRTDSMPKVIEAFNLKNHFDIVVCASDVEHPKPQPDVLLKIIEHFAIDPKQALYVGDSALDEAAAKAAAVPFVAYGNPSLKADYYIAGLKELEDILGIE